MDNKTPRRSLSKSKMNKAAAQRGAESTNTATGSKTTVGRPGCPPAAQQGVDGTEGGKEEGGEQVTETVVGGMEESICDSEDDSGQQNEADMEDFISEGSGPEATQEVFDPAAVVIEPETQSLPDRKYLEALKESYLELSQVIWKEEQPANRPALRDVPPDAWDDVVIAILATLPMTLLLELISGNIAREYYKKSGKVFDTLSYYKTREGQQPSIYVHILADDRGESPSCKALAEMIEFLRAYVKGDDDQLAYEIDRVRNSHWTRQKAKAGARNYLSTEASKKSRRSVSPCRVETLHQFCDNLESRINGIPKPQWEAPLPGHPLSEVGYALNATKRFQQHKDHTNSNWLMNLVEAVCAARFEGRLIMHQFVVFFIWDRPQAIIGECLFSKLCKSYVEDGGFNYTSAGSSNWTILQLNDIEQWHRFQVHALSRPPLQENIKNYHDRMREQWEEREKAKAELIATRAQLELLEAQLAALEGG
ncbi:hypothetical protein W97_06196 [Coniosporium apollinis CBS 100218]|uniref:Uncharacterized protein n=1 Tax=Coniosporium apollinis (strain CBS 100218) TaxID=1168221 RepID=R7YZ82_CONA1|nr:uncharacterized protein W97_06196 [Coniosporium apollinis CBS 100218]EON67079.1 hypothetical protein W97_06196 [Coniosporium apollinis CBS 100218]